MEVTDQNQIFFCHDEGRWANHGNSFSWTNSGLSSWGQCPTPSKTKRLIFGSLEGKELKYFPTGPSRGVNGSWFPHKTRTGMESFGINFAGFGPGGPVTIETKASSAPWSNVGSVIIYIVSKSKNQVSKIHAHIHAYAQK